MIDGHQLINLFRKVIQKTSSGTQTGNKLEEIKDGNNEKITKADCLSEQYEQVITDTFPEVTLERVYEKGNAPSKSHEKKTDASNS